MGRRRLPPELVVEILLLLPPKPLFRNKSVSKEWLRLISDPFLAAAYQSQNPPFFAGFIDNRYSPTFIPHNTQPVSPPHLPPPYSCYGSSNGLLLLLLDSQMCYYALSVLNPITGVSVQIPEFPIPNISSDVYGFICNLGSNGLASYKVFVVSMLNPSNRLQIATFSSDTRAWRTSYILLPRHILFDNCGSSAMVASDGIVYVINNDLIPEDGGWWIDDAGFIVISCDPTEGSAELIQHPPWDVDDCDCYFFSIREYYDGSLSVCRRSTWTRHLEVWVLSRDKTWTLKHTFSFGSESLRDCRGIQILYFCKDDRAIYLSLKSRIVRCYYEDEQWRFEDVCAYKHRYEPGIRLKPFIFSPWPISISAIAL